MFRYRVEGLEAHLATGRRLPRRAPVTFDQIFELVTLDNAQREAR